MKKFKKEAQKEYNLYYKTGGNQFHFDLVVVL